MIPIVLDPSAVAIALAGRGEIAAKRLAWLLAGGTERLVVYARRAAWRRERREPQDVLRLTEALIDAEGWLAEEPRR